MYYTLVKYFSLFLLDFAFPERGHGALLGGLVPVHNNIQENLAFAMRKGVYTSAISEASWITVVDDLGNCFASELS